ncbi:MAG: hypothetical protein J1F35_06970 [Erysipelotrichales bacterium]|nr:hypothetical protein [Erysipelotrichales bacterium]
MNKIKNINKKAFGILALIIIVAIGSIIVFNVTFSAGGVNTFYDVELKDTTVGDVTITDVEMNAENGITKYTATVKASANTEVKYINIKVLDKDNKELVTLIGYVGSTLSKNETKEIEASTDADLDNINSIEYEVIN